ncbi:MAG: hypothetical protein QM621_03130 [Aeromicrobium sp.]|uniref:hypothetical protein n=1 Tax=Aeromicrobium sp. TaxID=1871063 RepID=UPI0039E633D6
MLAPDRRLFYREIAQKEAHFFTSASSLDEPEFKIYPDHSFSDPVSTSLHISFAEIAREFYFIQPKCHFRSAEILRWGLLSEAHSAFNDLSGEASHWSYTIPHGEGEEGLSGRQVNFYIDRDEETGDWNIIGVTKFYEYF